MVSPSSLAFQSSLELSPECNAVGGVREGASRSGFNPHSSFRPSATWDSGRDSFCLAPVSILTRAFARVQPETGPPLGTVEIRFQSSLELSPECNHNHGLMAACELRFQSSLELSPECNLDQRKHIGCDRSFNPHSSFRPSATISLRGPTFALLPFQSSLELSPECNSSLGPAYSR